MDTDQYVDSIERDAGAMSEIGRSVPFSARVPSCPGWTLRDLIIHTGVVHRQKTETVVGKWLDSAPAIPDEPTGDVMVWFDEGVAGMLGAFRTHDLSQPTWTWCEHDHPASWWVRRMAHETAIHAADAILTAGGEPLLDAALATDGVDEILDEMIIGGPEWGEVIPGDQSIALETDDRRWVLTVGRFVGTSPTTGTAHDFGTAILDESAVPSATIRTDPSHLDLWLWGRGTLPKGAVAGDDAIVTVLRTIAADATG